MKKNIKILLICMISIFLCSNGAFAQQKLAQTGCQFLSVGMDARSAAMAEAFTSITANSNSLFYNPAGISRMQNLLDFNINHTSWIADIKYYTAGVTFKPFDIKYGIFGLSFQYVDYGEFQKTMVDTKTEKGFIDMGTFKPNAMAIGLGYGLQLSDKFSVGAHAKWVFQELGTSTLNTMEEVTNKIDVIAFDFGTIYWTGFKSLAFGMSVRNFSQEVTYQNEGFQLPLTFKLGISVDGLDLIFSEHKDHSLLIAVDAVHNRDYPEQINLGMEYTFMDLISFRGGYMFNNDEHGITGGIGIQQYGFAFDYAYTPFGIFDNVHRISFRFSL